jgi:hypothetical protein
MLPRLAATLAATLLYVRPIASQHAAAGCPYDFFWIGNTCPRVHQRESVHLDGEHRGCCIGGGRQGLCPANCPLQTVNADGSCTCGACDPPQPPACANAAAPARAPPVSFSLIVRARLHRSRSLRPAAGLRLARACSSHQRVADACMRARASLSPATTTAVLPHRRHGLLARRRSGPVRVQCQPSS